jgi:hypothetical protein
VIARVGSAALALSDRGQGETREVDPVGPVLVNGSRRSFLCTHGLVYSSDEMAREGKDNGWVPACIQYSSSLFFTEAIWKDSAKRHSIQTSIVQYG